MLPSSRDHALFKKSKNIYEFQIILETISDVDISVYHKLTKKPTSNSLYSVLRKNDKSVAQNIMNIFKSANFIIFV